MHYELALLGVPLDPKDITDHILDGLNEDYKPNIEAIHAHDAPLTFDELNEKLIPRELDIDKHMPALTIYPTVANPTHARSHYPCTSSHPKPAATPMPNQNPRNPFKGRCKWFNVQGHTLTNFPTFKDLHLQSVYPTPLANPMHPPSQCCHCPCTFLLILMATL